MQPTTYTVTVTAQFPAWDERDGYTFEVIAESALETMLLADIQASADRLSDIVQAREIFVRRQATSSWFAGRPDAEELNSRADRLDGWVVALMSVTSACDDALGAREQAA